MGIIDWATEMYCPSCLMLVSEHTEEWMMLSCEDELLRELQDSAYAQM